MELTKCSHLTKTSYSKSRLSTEAGWYTWLAKRHIDIYPHVYPFRSGKQNMEYPYNGTLSIKTNEVSGEGNGYPLQYSCLENSMDRGAWKATVHGITKSWTRLSNIFTDTIWMHLKNITLSERHPTQKATCTLPLT